METPQEYKQTEVGLIPDDWEVTQLQELIDPARKITYGIVVPGRNIPDGVPMIRAQDYSRGWVDINELYKVSTEIDKSYKRSKVVANDILLTIVGSVGNIAKVPSAFNGSNITQQTARIAFNKKIADPDFYLNILRSTAGQKEIFNYTKSGVQPSLNLSDVDKFRVPYPPLSEQQAIAQALSDVDAAIAELDRLITKKRNLKQGAMHQLLMGKKRLPGFSSEWGIKRLGEILKVRHGKSQHDIAEENGQFPILATGGEIGRAKTYLYDKPSVLIGRKGTIDVPQYMDSPFWTIDTLFYTQIFNNAFPKFVFYRFNLINWYSYNEASGVPSLSAKTIENIEVYLPCVNEQKAISQILSDMDAEIEALEQKRDKYKAIKQGMMQELLTGRTRLV